MPIKNLIFATSQCLLLIALGLVPVTFVAVYSSFGWPNFQGSEFFACSLTTGSLIIPTFDAIVTILVVGPYRDAVKNYAKSFVKWFSCDNVEMLC